MRAAKRSDIFKILASGGHPDAPKLTEISFCALPGFSDTELTPDSSFIVICGGTGSGKTALMQLLKSAVDGEAIDVRNSGPMRLGRAEIVASVRTGAKTRKFKKKLGNIPRKSSNPHEHGITFLGLEARTVGLRDYLSETDIDVLKNGIEPFSFDRRALSEISAACRREYDEIQAYEVELMDGNYEPLFEVKSGGVSYNNLVMSTGELSVMYLAWALKRSEAKSIIFIEEPEAHLPPSSHAAVFSLVADFSVAKQLCVVLSTHSPNIATHAHSDGIIALTRARHTSILPKSKSSKSRALAKLGLTPKLQALFLVEDAMARSGLSALLASRDFAQSCRYEILDVNGGFGQIKTVIESLENRVKTVKVVGVLDGDMQASSKKWKCHSYLAFLPFTRSIESELLECIENTPPFVAKSLGRTRELVVDSLEASIGDDHHDRFGNICSALDVSQDELVAVGLRVWLRKPKNRRAASLLLRRLGQLTGAGLG